MRSAPLATLAFGAALGTVYLAGVTLQGDLVLRPDTLLALGALRLPPARPADLLRLATAPFVHLDWQHLGTNLAVLLGLGAWPGRLERRCGSARLLGLLLLGGLAGSLAALLAYRDGPTLVAGASGALLALAAAGAAAPGPPPLRLGCAGVVLALLGGGLWLGDRAAGAAHLGGCALGLGFRAWARPRFR